MEVERSSACTPVGIAVIGGGVIGLSSALALVENGFSGLTIIAEQWSPQTTSDGAGALWEMRCEDHRRWAAATFRRYEQLMSNAATGRRAGVAYCDGVSWLGCPQETLLAADVVPWIKRAKPAEVAAASAASGMEFKDGWRYRSVIVDGPSYLAWMTEQLKAAGVIFVTRKINSIEEVVLDGRYQIVVNATGLGARELARDSSVHAVRGQTIRVRAPQVREWVCAENAFHYDADAELTYVLPRLTNGVIVCGGTYEMDDEDTSIRAETARGIWERCTRICPALLSGTVERVEEWTGLRPARDGDVKLEAEPFFVDLQPAEGDASAPDRQAVQLATVIHNYGHGGCGHSLHWGCALQVVELVNAVLATTAAANASAGKGVDER